MKAAVGRVLDCIRAPHRPTVTVGSILFRGTITPCCLLWLILLLLVSFSFPPPPPPPHPSAHHPPPPPATIEIHGRTQSRL